MTFDEWEAWMDDKPILRTLNESGVFSILRAESGRLKITEGCDQWFSVELTADEVAGLIAELRAVHAEMLEAQEAKSDE